MPELQAPSALPARWRISLVLLSLLGLLTKHYALQPPVHVGMFAGSLLQRDDWDH
jgi:hypothetical protein